MNDRQLETLRQMHRQLTWICEDLKVLDKEEGRNLSWLCGTEGNLRVVLNSVMSAITYEECDREHEEMRRAAEQEAEA